MRFGLRDFAFCAMILSVLMVHPGRPASTEDENTSCAGNGTGLFVDFNGDSLADLAVGALFEDMGSKRDVGVVHVLYGSSDGLSAESSQIWHQDSIGIEETADEGDMFGEELHAGDLNGDGFGDLAVGVPFENMVSIEDAGIVHILYGSHAGLSADNSQIWHQDSPGIEDEIERRDLFGEELAVGDFNGDGLDDLTIGIPLEDVGQIRDAGAVQVLYGSPAGLSADSSQIWHQDSPGIEDEIERGDFFGEELAVGDFNGDGYADLAVGVLHENMVDIENAGAVNVLYGSATGLSAAGNQFWHQDSPGAMDDAEEGDLLGAELATGDFNGDGFADLAVGGYRENIGDIEDAGAVNVLYGSPAGLSAANDQFWHQNSSGILGIAREGDCFGYALAVGDFNADGFADLTSGVPYKAIGMARSAGGVNVLYGSLFGLSAINNQFLHQNSPGLWEVAEVGDRFGWDLTASDFDADCFADLAVGVLNESVGATRSAGATNILYGSPTGLGAAANQLWHQNRPGVNDETETRDCFGYALSDVQVAVR
jgi:hypothetical protein